MKSSVQETQVPLDINKIVDDCCEICGIDLREKSRKREVVIPRHAAMYAISEFLPFTLSEVGGAFGQDHTTVVHARKSAKNAVNQKDKHSILCAKYLGLITICLQKYIPEEEQEEVKKDVDEGLKTYYENEQKMEKKIRLLMIKNIELISKNKELEKEIRLLNLTLEANEEKFQEWKYQNGYKRKKPKPMTDEERELQRLEALKKEYIG